MIELISKCNDFLKDCGVTYVFCGGYALELFANKKIRTHSDIDISIFDEDREKFIDFLLQKGWNAYEPVSNPKSLAAITHSGNGRASKSQCVWAIKPGCTFFKIEPKHIEGDIFNYEILSGEQLEFDFMEIIFNKYQDDKFICSKDKNIIRELEKSILYNNGIPYLAPELILFICANPAYMESDYHKEKNQMDFDFTAPLLSKDSREWLINAIEAAYPKGNKRLDNLNKLATDTGYKY